MTNTSYVRRNDKVFALTFDEYDYLDTVERVTDGKPRVLLNSENADVKYFVTHQHRLAQRLPVGGVVYAKKA